MSENYSGFTSLNVEGNDSVVSYTVQRKKRMMIVGVGVTVGCAMLLAFVMFGSSAAKTGLATLMAPGFSFGSTFGSSDGNATESWAVGTECEVDPCNGNGHCYVDESGNKLGKYYYCACMEGWCGYDCEIGITSDQTCADVYAQEGSSTSSSSSSSPGSPRSSSSSSSTSATEAPATEAPATEAPATEAPATEAPATEAPATEAPATEAPTTSETKDYSDDRSHTSSWPLSSSDSSQNTDPDDATTATEAPATDDTTDALPETTTSYVLP